ncbi:MAG: hypothetical protein HND52_13755 [Ignavibacteriae bacterium]|nr:hypothetical protein [Ignavibacteriota bacterium]NOG99019.1 hypothetical protein [Ignavibacteriota bacterium]
MNNSLKVILSIIFAALLLLSGCEVKESGPTDGEETEGGTVTITGQVVESSSGNPINNALVKVTDFVNENGGATNSSGMYSVTLDIDKNKEVFIVVSLTGYSADTTSVFATIDASVQAPLVQLKQESGTGQTPSGGAASVYLYEQSSESIGVKESGSIQTAQIIFEVQDSNGVHIDLDNQETVQFTLGNSPGGGEYLHPSSVKTNALGRASVTLNTGFTAGVVQVIAEITKGNETIRSKPVLIAIHGGLPDDGHFHVASEKLNYPALGIIGYDIGFTAYVGDKFSNPVRPGTAVYFETTSGIIEGSNLTSDLGTANVTLLTQPWPELPMNDPDYPNLGKGFFKVTAKTANENYDQILTKTVRLQSGQPFISQVSPSTFNLANGGSQSFSFNVADLNNNPIASGNTISVSVASGDIEVSGDISIRMPDVLAGMTTFYFTVSDSKSDEDKPQTASVTISSAGPNGDASFSITGTSR